ncbi:hypothetical protein IQ244_18495 [Nostoc sp. LEGE 06077]|uniref:hypothetical protein n=1 Tax=Nostoc sp. LEGE 06077 TaxID=915325 RepID=UPI00187FD00C|nr:hypothetical protein [Nostoc sp. LEGE 06077]MBE9208486.1 hypothetical protein [Nostoc sp. LEGE 06077]
MLTTIELRWFYPGQIPTEIEQWFPQNCSREKREDWYLYAPACDYLGIKLRQERLEVKWRKAELGVLCFGELIEGKAEKWSKWMCSDSTGESFQPSMVFGNSVWVNVQKVRRLQSYKIFPNSSVQAVSSNESIDNGCSVEITQLLIQEQTWWSLALEAVGEYIHLQENLYLMASCVFNNYRGTKLIAANSYAYPHWLDLILGNYS